ncbi:hypothetical protein EDB81DRAFT_41136 [Dactylonectria macrodidyma]|uniref:Uncharacterized protein n=1 Tax=Dactylonectria macrodidyma TaxID=307937 RepID=A0A9P9FU44_9HYPO|nr:hypothetical protein EDB81DRAFT_41136 [Dactylonectria macrodidyma]
MPPPCSTKVQVSVFLFSLSFFPFFYFPPSFEEIITRASFTLTGVAVAGTTIHPSIHPQAPSPLPAPPFPVRCAPVPCTILPNLDSYTQPLVKPASTHLQKDMRNLLHTASDSIAETAQLHRDTYIQTLSLPCLPSLTACAFAFMRADLVIF